MVGAEWSGAVGQLRIAQSDACSVGGGETAEAFQCRSDLYGFNELCNIDPVDFVELDLDFSLTIIRFTIERGFESGGSRDE